MDIKNVILHKSPSKRWYRNGIHRLNYIPSSKDHIAAALLSKLMTLLLWLITPVRICLVKQWPHITVYAAFYHYRLRKSMTLAPAGTIILCPSANIICIGTLF